MCEGLIAQTPVPFHFEYNPVLQKHVEKFLADSVELSNTAYSLYL